MSSKISKMLSYILRHKPEEFNIILDDYGFAKVSDILKELNTTLEELENVVDSNNKKRFRFNEDKTLIKANQGHSISIKNDMELIKSINTLYHGTKKQFLDSIMKDGLIPMDRLHVHLSKDIETATIVANRRKGDNIILEIDSQKMIDDGLEIYISENGVYLTNQVLPKYFK